MLLISNSEVSSYLTCSRRHYYAHLSNLEPKTFSIALTRGVIGHEIMAAYYQALQDGASFDRAKKVALAVWMRHYSDESMDLEILVFLRQLIEQYWEYYSDDCDRWEILGVEESYQIPMPGNDNKYGMRLDLRVRVKQGQYLGEHHLIDHKFVYNLKKQDEVNLDAQIPKYIATIRLNGDRIDRAMFNQLRHRHLKTKSIPSDERYSRHFYRPTERKIATVMSEQFTAAARIAPLYDMTLEEAEATTLRILQPMICGYCPFNGLCDTELNGDDTSLMRKTEFQANAYNAKYRELLNEDS